MATSWSTSTRATRLSCRKACGTRSRCESQASSFTSRPDRTATHGRLPARNDDRLLTYRADATPQHLSGAVSDVWCRGVEHMQVRDDDVTRLSGELDGSEGDAVDV